MMSESAPSSCPSCDSTNLERIEAIDAERCSECSLVIDGELADVSTGSEVEGVQSIGSESSEAESWDEEVAVSDKSEQNLVELLSLVEEISTALELPAQVELESAELAANAWEENFMHGRSMEATVGAAIYSTSRATNQTIPPAIIAGEVGISKTKLLSSFRKLRHAQHLDLDPPQPTDYLHFLCFNRGFGQTVKRDAERRLHRSNYARGDPVGIACAAVYKSAQDQGHDITLREIAANGSLTKETIWRHTQKID